MQVTTLVNIHTLQIFMSYTGILKNGENWEIIFIFPFKTEEKNDSWIRRQLWTEMTSYKNNQKARRVLHINLSFLLPLLDSVHFFLSQKIKYTILFNLDEIQFLSFPQKHTMKRKYLHNTTSEI